MANTEIPVKAGETICFIGVVGLHTVGFYTELSYCRQLALHNFQCRDFLVAPSARP